MVSNMKKSFIILCVALSGLVAISTQAGTESKNLSQLSLVELYGSTASDDKITVSPRSDDENGNVDFLNAFFSMLPALRKSNVNLSRWFREDHIVYLTDYLSAVEKAQMIPIFREIESRITQGQTDMRAVLTGLQPAALVAKVAKLDNEVLRLKEQHKDVIRFAITKHETENHQSYGEMPYSFHLRKVRGVLKRFGFGPKDSFFALKLGTAAWLHDSIEDTDATYEQISELFGGDIAEIVRGVTKIEKSPGLSSAERLQRTFARTALNKGSRVLKLADRIANVEEGLTELFSGNPSKVHKYFEEWPLFKRMLYVQGDADLMWFHLEKLLTDVGYAQSASLKLIQNRESDCSSLLGSAI